MITVKIIEPGTIVYALNVSNSEVISLEVAKIVSAHISNSDEDLKIEYILEEVVENGIEWGDTVNQQFVSCNINDLLPILKDYYKKINV